MAVGVLPIGNGLALPLERRPPWDAARTADWDHRAWRGVIKTEISAQRGEIAVGRTVERIIAAVELARRYPDARLVFAGGVEGDFIVRLLEKFGVSQDRVIVERESRNTFENAAFAEQLVMPKAGERWLLVTSAMHMPRAVGVFRKAGFAVDAYPVDYLTSGAKDLWTLSGNLMGGVGISDLVVHEWIGLLAYWMAGLISEPFPGRMSEMMGRSLRFVRIDPWPVGCIVW